MVGKTYEGLGTFYLGRIFDLKKKKGTDDLVLYDSKDLVTHSVCVGMTGSGKTGLCLTLLEEAAKEGKTPAEFAKEAPFFKDPTGTTKAAW